MSGLRVWCVLFFFFSPAASVFPAFAETSEDWRALVDRMERVYAGVTDYRAEMEVTTYGSDGSSETDRFLYTFKKPKWIRLDFESPHRGMIIVFPDKKGKAVIRPVGLARFFTLHLAPDNPLIKASSGQPIDKTDMGLLIESIAHSVTDERRGSLEVWDRGDRAVIRVPALNHFRKGLITLYEFSIDTRHGLPVEVKEMTLEGTVVRDIIFRSLEINRGAPDSLFRLDGERDKGEEEKDGK